MTKLTLAGASLASLVLLGSMAYDENFRGEWRVHQKAYRALLVRGATDGVARQAAKVWTIEYKQIYLPDLATIDRCTTCHLATENPAMTDAVPPLSTHPGELLIDHPVDRFGCTICHQGVGRAVTREAAHGWRDDGSATPHVETPLLRGQAVYTSCGRCHTEWDLFGGEADLYSAGDSGGEKSATYASIDAWSLATGLPGAATLSEGKRLFVASGCLGCHQYRGRGGVLGPDLTYVGDKTRHDFDFSHVRGEHTVQGWLFEHFMYPAEVSPGTIMPALGISPVQARQLALYMMGLHRKDAPASHRPRSQSALDPSSSAPADGATLYRMFCSACHGADGRGSTVRSGMWPVELRERDPWERESLRPDIVAERRDAFDLPVPSLNHADTLAVASDDYLRRIIRSGREGTNMLAWDHTQGGLTEAEIDRLVNYVRSWEPTPPTLESIRASSGDVRRGRALYRSRCLSCHGHLGEGEIGVNLNSPSFLAAASDEFLARTIVDGRANTAMPSWKQLSAGDVADLIALLRSWQSAPPDRQAVLDKLAEGKPSRRSLRIGKSLYRGHCATCHGSAGEGAMGPSLNSDDFLALVDDHYLYTAIVHGRPGTAMPAWNHLAVDDVVDLIHHMRQWNKGNRREPDSYTAHGDWEHGRLIYQGSCAPCHGATGEGSTGPQLNNPTFLSTVSDAVLREWIAYGRMGTPMQAFLRGRQGMVELRESEIEDVITYLRHFEIESPWVTARPGIGVISLGQEVYAAACAQCHGPNGEGMTGSALANPDFLRAASDGYLQATMVLGRDGTEMRAMGRGSQGNIELGPDEISNVVAFIRNWQDEPPPDTIPARYVTAADVDMGRTMYAGHCAGCHGTSGDNGWAPALNNRQFLAAASDGFLQATIAVGRAGTAMRPFGRGAGGVAELSSGEIQTIVAYVRTWAAPENRPTQTPIQNTEGQVAQVSQN